MSSRIARRSAASSGETVSCWLVDRYPCLIHRGSQPRDFWIKVARYDRPSLEPSRVDYGFLHLMTLALINQVRKVGWRPRRAGASPRRCGCHPAKEWSYGLQSMSRQRFGAPSSEFRQRLKPNGQSEETLDRPDERTNRTSRDRRRPTAERNRSRDGRWGSQSSGQRSILARENPCPPKTPPRHHLECLDMRENTQSRRDHNLRT